MLGKIDGLYLISIQLEKKIDNIATRLERLESGLTTLLRKMDDILVERELLGDAAYESYKYEGASQFGFLRE